MLYFKNTIANVKPMRATFNPATFLLDKETVDIAKYLYGFFAGSTLADVHRWVDVAAKHAWDHASTCILPPEMDEYSAERNNVLRAKNVAPELMRYDALRILFDEMPRFTGAATLEALSKDRLLAYHDTVKAQLNVTGDFVLQRDDTGASAFDMEALQPMTMALFKHIVTIRAMLNSLNLARALEAVDLKQPFNTGDNARLYTRLPDNAALKTVLDIAANGCEVYCMMARAMRLDEHHSVSVSPGMF